jgi:anti-sigma regulatory factor (Ser/Thr protein kinase)
MDGRPLDHTIDRILADLLKGGVDDDVAILGLGLAPLKTETLSLRLPAEPESLAHVRVALREWLSGAGVSGGRAAEVVTAVGEATANVVSHAYGIARGDMEIDGTRTPEEVVIAVRDFGRWRESLGGGGRGASLMRALMDSVEIDSRETGTVIRLRKRLQTASVS